jgi:peptidoglycan/LPS O-acetylase OafA/YrhL
VVLDDRLLAFAPAVAVLLATVWSAAVLAGLRRSGVLARMLAVRPLAMLGKISFGVYLWHMFPLRFLMDHGASGPAASGWLVFAATVALAGFTYVAVERPGILSGRRLGDSLFACAKREPPASR